MKIEKRVSFTEAEENAVDAVVQMLEDLVEGNEISNVHIYYNPAQDIALEELWGIMIDFQGFVHNASDWKIED